MRPVRKADKLTTILCRCEELTFWNPLGHPRPVTALLYLLHYLRTLTSWKPLGHSRPVTGLLYLFFISSPSKFFLLWITARNNQFSRNSAESTVFFCHLCTRTLGYSAKWKSLQTYFLVNQPSQSNSPVMARYFQNTKFFICPTNEHKLY
jgi:hypothetical protein